MPVAMERALKRKAKEKGLTGKEEDRFVYGIMRRHGWKPKVDKSRKNKLSVMNDRVVRLQSIKGYLHEFLSPKSAKAAAAAAATAAAGAVGAGAYHVHKTLKKQREWMKTAKPKDVLRISKDLYIDREGAMYPHSHPRVKSSNVTEFAIDYDGDRRKLQLKTAAVGAVGAGALYRAGAKAQGLTRSQTLTKLGQNLSSIGRGGLTDASDAIAQGGRAVKASAGDAIARLLARFRPAAAALSSRERLIELDVWPKGKWYAPVRVPTNISDKKLREEHGGIAVNPHRLATTATVGVLGYSGYRAAKAYGPAVVTKGKDIIDRAKVGIKAGNKVQSGGFKRAYKAAYEAARHA